MLASKGKILLSETYREESLIGNIEFNMSDTILFYLSSILGIVCPIWIAIEIYLWIRFIKYIKKDFFYLLIACVLIYSVINVAILIYGLTSNVGFGYIDYNLIPLVKTYIHAIIPLFLAIMMRLTNYRAAHASPDIQHMIQKAFTALTYSERQLDEIDKVIETIDKKIN